jgi:hypothetical protein
MTNSSPSEQHRLLDNAMACWAADTGRLFSDTSALELVIWLNERQMDPDYAPMRAAVIHLLELAAAGDPAFTPASSIMDLAEWSFKRLRA